MLPLSLEEPVDECAAVSLSNVTAICDLKCPCPEERLIPSLLINLYPRLKSRGMTERWGGGFTQGHHQPWAFWGKVIQNFFFFEPLIFFSPYTTACCSLLCSEMFKSNMQPVLCTYNGYSVFKKAHLWEAWWSSGSDSLLMLWADRIWRFSWASQIAVTGAGEQVVPQLAETSHN